MGVGLGSWWVLRGMWGLGCASSLSPQRLSALQRFKSSVYRRYNDFVVFHEMLLHKFPYRMVPALPPKRVLGGEQGLGGQWLLSDGKPQHPALECDVLP